MEWQKGYEHYEYRGTWGCTTLIEVKSVKDREGNKVSIDDIVGYFHGTKLMRSGRVIRITKSGYHVEVYIEGHKHPLQKPYIEKLFTD
ncbi:hypothetical protein GCM10023310_70360 [Paenibacillus vulneris]